jgi:Sel1 repeat
MGQHAKPVRATLTTLVMLVAMAGAAGAEDEMRRVTAPVGDFFLNAGCPLDDCPPRSRVLDDSLPRPGISPADQRAFAAYSQVVITYRDEPPGTPQARLVANAFVELGQYYLKGIPNSTIAADAGRAREMFAYAASYFGDADAQYELGRLYLDGSPSDPQQAVRWFQLAAIKGDYRAKVVLTGRCASRSKPIIAPRQSWGDILFQGQRVPRQAARGLTWVTLGRDCVGLEVVGMKPACFKPPLCRPSNGLDWIIRFMESMGHIARATPCPRPSIAPTTPSGRWALVYLENWLKGRGE